MLLAFFDSKSLVYSHIVPRGSTFNAVYIHSEGPGCLDEALSRVSSSIGTMPLFTPPTVSRIGSPPTASRSSTPDPALLPDLAPTDFFLFQRGKDKLAGVTLEHSTLKKEWEGVTTSFSLKSLPPPSRYERCQK
jgi:hypothetical protein